MKIIKVSFAIFIIICIFSFCNKQKKDNENALLEEYLAELEENNIDYKELEKGVYLIKSGFSTPETLESETASAGDTIVSFYQGYLLSNPETVFDEKNISEPQEYVYLQDKVIPGWEIAMAYMKKDESAKIIIHSDYAYKGDQVGLIPPFSTLIYEVRILDIKKGN